MQLVEAVATGTRPFSPRGFGTPVWLRLSSVADMDTGGVAVDDAASGAIARSSFERHDDRHENNRKRENREVGAPLEGQVLRSNPTTWMRQPSAWRNRSE